MSTQSKGYPSTPEDKQRIADYEFYQHLFFGEHEQAFASRVANFKQSFKTSEDDTIRYVMTNFAGMLSKLAADMLFMEQPRITLPQGDNEWLGQLMRDSRFRTQLYESGLENSYRGDAIFRVGSRNGRVVLEDITPAIYFPEYDQGNVRRDPSAKVLAWKLKLTVGTEQKECVRIERHTEGLVENELWTLDKSGIIETKLDIKAYFPNVPEKVDTKIKDFLVFHVKNWGVGSRHFGVSDYKDLVDLFYAINNRKSRVDNILDKHGDPILAVPDGVLNAEGEVDKRAFGVIEVPTDESSATPQYIVWDAKLEAAFKEIDQNIEHLFMTSETSPAAFGLDKDGAQESGRALKFKLMRTLAKSKRKQLYYDDELKNMLFVAQQFAQANKLKTSDGKTVGTASPVEIEWSDGILNDRLEDIEVEERRLEMGTTTVKDSIARLDGLSDEEAQKRADEIKKEQEANMPKFGAQPVAPDNGNGTNK